MLSGGIVRGVRRPEDRGLGETSEGFCRKQGVRTEEHLVCGHPRDFLHAPAKEPKKTGSKHATKRVRTGFERGVSKSPSLGGLRASTTWGQEWEGEVPVSEIGNREAGFRRCVGGGRSREIAGI